MAKLSESVDNYCRVLHGIPDSGASVARYVQTLRDEATRLCEKYGAELIMGHFREELGGQQFTLYFGVN